MYFLYHTRVLTKKNEENVKNLEPMSLLHPIRQLKTHGLLIFFSYRSSAMDIVRKYSHTLLNVIIKANWIACPLLHTSFRVEIYVQSTSIPSVNVSVNKENFAMTVMLGCYFEWIRLCAVDCFFVFRYM